MFCRLPVSRAGVWLLTAAASFLVVAFNTEASVLEETLITLSLDNVTQTISRVDPIVAVDLDITYPDSHDVSSIQGFSLALAYDMNVLTLSNILDYGLQDECGWSFGWINNHDTTGYPNSVLWVYMEKSAGAPNEEPPCIESGAPLITIEFEQNIGSDYPISTSVNFYWRDCSDNIIWTNDHDTTILAMEVFDADVVNITDDSEPLPSFTGPNSSCFEPFGDTVLVQAIRFQSGKIEFKAPTDVVENPIDGENLPETAELKQNYPNPFNPVTAIQFYLPVKTEWRLDIINLNGQIVSEFSGVNGPSNVTLNWDGRDRRNQPVSSGVYFYRLVTEKHTSSRKMLLLK